MRHGWSTKEVPSFRCQSIKVQTNDYYFLPSILTIILIYAFDWKEFFMAQYFANVSLRRKHNYLLVELLYLNEGL